MSSEELLKRKKRIMADLQETSIYLEKGYQETIRVRSELAKTRETLDDLDRQFKEETGLTDIDVVFLFVAIGLQIVRQYLFSNEKFRLTSSQGDKLIEDSLSLAPPKWQNILLQSVPYDAIITSGHVSGTGLSGTTHRYRTLGHDPLLGWVFGTANIMTNALTKTNLETYQVNIANMQIVRRYPLGVAGMLERAMKYGMNDPVLFATSVARQAIHFGSDYFTMQGLPIPIIATVNNDLAKTMLTKWHIDAYSITRGVALSSFINMIIYLLHGLFFDGDSEMDRKLYEVRTRKILSYSNLVATSSNALVVALTNDLRKLDIGGISVTIYRLITDSKFIKKIKHEFVFGNYHDIIMGDQSYLYTPKP